MSAAAAVPGDLPRPRAGRGGRPTGLRRWAYRVGTAIVPVAVVNFLSFAALSLAWGGDGPNGKVVDGQGG